MSLLCLLPPSSFPLNLDASTSRLLARRLRAFSLWSTTGMLGSGWILWCALGVVFAILFLSFSFIPFTIPTLRHSTHL
ncbi:hypothetical protein R3P38DRAFT_3187493 [Favolaschia claudopus]|uniref:Uncharacterized protein n=1 Tax=Favolaschia claudopus TaxID=2862362 RepID=A0AAW0BYU8_9AGAR